MRVDICWKFLQLCNTYLCKNFFAEWMNYYLFGARFKLYIVLIFRGSVWTLVCTFIYIDVFYIDACVVKWILLLNDVWNVFLSTCIFTYDAVDELFVYSLCLYDLNLYSVSWTLYCYSFFKILSLCMYYMMFSYLCFFVPVFIFLTSILLSIKQQKQSLIYEVPKHCYHVV